MGHSVGLAQHYGGEIHDFKEGQGKKNYRGKERDKLAVASSANLLDNTLCLFLTGRGKTGRSAAW